MLVASVVSAVYLFIIIFFYSFFFKRMLERIPSTVDDEFIGEIADIKIDKTKHIA